MVAIVAKSSAIDAEKKAMCFAKRMNVPRIEASIVIDVATKAMK